MISVIMAGWVFFRSETLPYAFSYLSAMAGFAQGSGIEYHIWLYINAKVLLFLLIGLIGAMPILEMLKIRLESLRDTVSGLYGIIKVIQPVSKIIFYCIVLLLSAIFLSNELYNPFIYFKF